MSPETFDLADYVDIIAEINGKYYTKSELKYRKHLLIDENLDRTWRLVAGIRKLHASTITLCGKPFSYMDLKGMHEKLHFVDKELMKTETTDHIKEAIFSSKIEGAHTEEPVAVELVTKNKKPKDNSERMIVNNYKALDFVSENIDVEMSDEFILDLHQILVRGTDAHAYSGAYRTQMVYVKNEINGDIVHYPPEGQSVACFMRDFCAFVNGGETFYHPIVKASIIHFLFAYIHPFSDGNGRTARALFYWYLLKHDYGRASGVSISKMIADKRNQYDQAFLKTEHAGNDLTYFVKYSIEAIESALLDINRAAKTQAAREEKVERLAKELAGAPTPGAAEKKAPRALNGRQAHWISALYHKQKREITIDDLVTKDRITRQTASKDMKALVEAGLLEVAKKKGRKAYYRLADKSAVDELVATRRRARPSE